MGSHSLQRGAPPGYASPQPGEAPDFPSPSSRLCCPLASPKPDIHSHLLHASWTMSLFLLPGLWAESVWVWEESWVFSTSLHFPSELGFQFLPQLSVLPFLGCPASRPPRPSLQTTRQIETDCKGLPVALLLGAKVRKLQQEPPWGRCPGGWREEQQRQARQPCSLPGGH